MKKLTLILLAALIAIPAFSEVWRLTFRDPNTPSKPLEMHLPSSTKLTFNVDSATLIFHHNDGKVEIPYSKHNRGCLELKHEPKDYIDLPTRFHIKIGDRDTLPAQHYDADGSPLNSKFIWTSDAPWIVDVDSTGRIRARAYGYAKITAMAQAPSWITTTCTVETDVYTHNPTVESQSLNVTQPDAHTISITGALPGTDTKLYSIDGSLLMHLKTDASGSLLINTGNNHGPYLLYIAGAIFKLISK